MISISDSLVAAENCFKCSKNKLLNASIKVIYIFNEDYFLRWCCFCCFSASIKNSLKLEKTLWARSPLRNFKNNMLSGNKN
jgi:hypothetical protein